MGMIIVNIAVKPVKPCCIIPFFLNSLHRVPICPAISVGQWTIFIYNTPSRISYSVSERKVIKLMFSHITFYSKAPYAVQE